MKRLPPLATLLVTVALVSAFRVAYVVAGTDLSPTASLLSSIVLALSFVLWVVADSRRRAGLPCYDFGYLVAVYFPASLIWYAISSRGWRGLLTLAALFGLAFVPGLSAYAAWLLLY